MRLALIGVGLIGGSFAKALREARKLDRVVGFDIDAEALRRAAELHVIDECAPSAAKAVDQADLVLIAVPVGSVQQVFRDIASNLSKTAIVTDVSSTKASVVDHARRELGAAFARFVPGHPIAGIERSGVQNADAALFHNRTFVSTPVGQTDQDAARRVEALWMDLGAHVQRMTPEEHDAVFAAVSHLPHLLAFALVAHIAEQSDSQRKFKLAGSGFRDFTRIAASNPRMWRDICIANSAAISAELSAYRDRLTMLQTAVEAQDADALERVFTRNASGTSANTML